MIDVYHIRDPVTDYTTLGIIQTIPELHIDLRGEFMISFFAVEIKRMCLTVFPHIHHALLAGHFMIAEKWNIRHISIGMGNTGCVKMGKHILERHKHTRNHTKLWKWNPTCNRIMNLGRTVIPLMLESYQSDHNNRKILFDVLIYWFECTMIIHPPQSGFMVHPSLIDSSV